MSTATLVLDIGYQPHRIVSWQRAVALLFERKAELLETYDDRLMTDEQANRAREHGWTIVLKVPAVIRLLQKLGRKRAVKFSRMNILARDNWTCCYCGRKLPTNELNYDHVIPRSRGGKTVWENIVTACYSCNAKKQDRLPHEAGMKLRKQPVKPASLPIMAFHIDRRDALPDVWASWLFWNSELEQS